MNQIIIAISSTPPVTGQSLAGDMLLRALRRRGLEMTHLDLSRGTMVRHGLKDHLERGKDAMTLTAELRQSLRNSGPATFYLHLGQSTPAFLRDILLLRTARRSGARRVVHIHGGGFRSAFDNSPSVLRRTMAHELQTIDDAIVLSESLRAMLHGLVPDHRIHVVPNGISRDLTHHTAGPLRRREGEPLRVLHLSNLIPSKGYLEVLRMAALAQTRGIPAEFTLAGPHFLPDAPNPHDLIESRGLTNVQWIGPVHGPPKQEALNSHHVFLFPSKYPPEGQPLAILEAMHHGMPILASRQGGIPDVVTPEVGWCISPERITTFVDRLANLFEDDDLRLRLGRKAQIIAQSTYTEDQHTSQMLQLLGAI